MSQALDNLAAKVAAQTTVVDSVVALMSTLAAEARANKDDPAAIEALAAKIEADTQKLAGAVAAGTAAEGETPPAG